MAIIGIDLGGTKIAAGLFIEYGEMKKKGGTSTKWGNWSGSWNTHSRSNQGTSIVRTI